MLVAHMHIAKTFTFNINASFRLSSSSCIRAMFSISFQGLLMLKVLARHVPCVTLTHRAHTASHKSIICTCHSHNTLYCPAVKANSSLKG
jgi:hypothetical protein